MAILMTVEMVVRSTIAIWLPTKVINSLIMLGMHHVAKIVIDKHITS